MIRSMVRFALALLLCVTNHGCATTPFGESRNRSYAEDVVHEAYESGDKALHSQARQLLQQPDDMAAYATARCLSTILDGLKTERRLAADDLGRAADNARRLEGAAESCISECAKVRRYSEANDFEKTVADDVYHRCDSRWGAHQEKVRLIVLEARIPTLEKMASRRQFIFLEEGLRQLERDERGEVLVAQRLTREATSGLIAKIKALRAKYANELARVGAYQRDPQTIAAATRYRRIEDERQVLSDIVRTTSACRHEQGEDHACASEYARMRVAQAKLDDLDVEQQELMKLLTELRAAAGLDAANDQFP